MFKKLFYPAFFILFISSLISASANFGSGIYGSGLFGSSTTIIINSTFGTNLTTENITIYPAAITQWENISYRNVTDWKVNGSSMAKLNMAFEANLTANGSTMVKDYSDSNNHGIVYSAVWNATGGHDGRGAFTFDGNNDLIDLPWNVTYNDTDFTFSTWIIMNGTFGASPAVVVGSFRTSPIVYMGVSSTGQMYSRINFNASLNIDKTTTAGLKDQEWHHIAVTFDRDGNMTQYVDGANISTTNISTLNGLGLHPTSSLNTVKIGAGNSAGNPLSEFNGSIDEVMIFDRALSPQQIWALYTNQTNVIVSDETTIGDVWSGCVTPVNSTYELALQCSSNLTIINASTPSTNTGSGGGGSASGSGGSGLPAPNYVCGNGILENGEQCDSGEGCTLECECAKGFESLKRIDCKRLSYCGDGSVNQEREECDGTDLSEEDCSSLGYSTGILTCTKNCAFDKSNCRVKPETSQIEEKVGGKGYYFFQKVKDTVRDGLKYLTDKSKVLISSLITGSRELAAKISIVSIAAWLGKQRIYVLAVFLAIAILVGIFLLPMPRFTKRSGDQRKSDIEDWVNQMSVSRTAISKIPAILKKFSYLSKDEVKLVVERLKARQLLEKKYGPNPQMITELKEFVLSEKKKGAAAEEIIADLVREGWDEKVIKLFVNAYFPDKK